MPTRYQKSLRAALSQAERRLFERLNTADRIQDFLDRLPINFELDGDTQMSPRRVLRERRAHCAEGALLAAACLAYHGERPLLMDLRALPADQDHVVTLYRRNGLWGAISKTNHAVLRFRDAVYRTPRELAVSYAHEYYLPDGRKSLTAYSRPFSLARYAPDEWVTSGDDLSWLIAELDDSPHLAIAPKRTLGRRRKVSPIERFAGEFTEWRHPRRKPAKPRWTARKTR